MSLVYTKMMSNHLDIHNLVEEIKLRLDSKLSFIELRSFP